jgi:3-isopropylmalate dehydrogenase
MASASLGTRATDHGRFGMYDPVHGSAPTIAGQGVANPIATVASAAMLLRWSLGETEAADELDAIVDAAIEEGPRTGDLGGSAGTGDVAQFLLARIGHAAPVEVTA